MKLLEPTIVVPFPSVSPDIPSNQEIKKIHCINRLLLITSDFHKTRCFWISDIWGFMAQRSIKLVMASLISCCDRVDCLPRRILSSSH